MKNTSTTPDTPPTIRFRLTDNDLIVENFGENAKAFTRKGVISICYTSLSAKSNHITDLKCENSELPDKIGEELKQLKPNSRRAHIGNETRTIEDYFGRFVLELLQNADDAVNKESDEMIGMKGLGFKSIFEITDEPEIRSGDFHFRLKKESDGLRIPECIKVVECAATTQIRLPFRDDAAKKSAQAAIGEIESMRAGILLFCQSLQRIDIEIDGLPSRRLEIRIVPRDDENIDQIRVDDIDQIRVDDIELVEKSGEEIISATWRRWLCKPQSASGGKHISAGVCLPLDNEGKISSCEKDESLRVFFPTEEQIEGARALIHASCEVESNRKRLSDAESPDRESICKMLHNLVKEILSSQKDSAGALLRAFGKIKTAENPDNKKMVNRLGNAIAEAVRETAFVPVIGGDFVKPAEVCLWEFGIGKVLRPEKVRDQKLLAPDLEKEIEILGGLGASKIDEEEHARILRHCKNNLLEECLEAAKTAAKIAAKYAHAGVTKTIESLREAPFWWTGKIGRALNGEPHLLRKWPVEWPNLIKFEALDSDFSNELTPPATNADKTQAPENGDFNSLKICRIWPLEPSDYFERVLLPFCQDKGVEWWQDNGGKILSWVLKWSGKSKMPDQAQRNVYFPTDKGWLVAVNCYAGEAWGGPAHFDSFFKDIPNRGVVLPLKDWGMSPDAGNSKENWDPLLKQLCILRMPKKWRCFPGRLRDIGHDFGLENDAIEWLIRGIPPNHYVNFIDHFPKSMGKKPSEILKMAINMKRDGCEFSDFSQFQTCRWLPCTQAILSREGERLARPKDVYMPGCGLGGLLREINKKGVKDEEWLGEGGIKNLLASLKVCEKLEDGKFSDWMQILQEKADKLGAEDESLHWSEESPGAAKTTKKRGALAEAAKAVYAYYLKKSAEIPKDSPAPYLHKTDKGEFVKFAAASELFRLDKPYLAEHRVRKAIIETKDFKVFFLYENTDKSGLRPLSEELALETHYGDDKSEETDRLRKRYKERRPILQAAIDSVYENAAKHAFPKNSEIIFAYLGIHREAKKFPAIRPEIEYEQAEEKLFINVANNRKWDSLAAGLAAMANVSPCTNDLELLLSRNHDGCMRLLLDRFDLTEESLRKLEFTPTEAAAAPDSSETTTTPAASDRSSFSSSIAGEKESVTPAVSAVHSSPRSANSGGKSGSSDPEANKEVEEAAMQAAKSHYEDNGYKVKSVETENRGWDLEAAKGEKRLLVEVKGISKDRVFVSLTHNEFKAAKQHRPDYRLAVFRNIPNNHRCAIYKQCGNGDQWQWIEGDNTAAKQLKTKNKADIVQD